MVTLPRPETWATNCTLALGTTVAEIGETVTVTLGVLCRLSLPQPAASTASSKMIALDFDHFMPVPPKTFPLRSERAAHRKAKRF
jgi:hypothetical protein